MTDQLDRLKSAIAHRYLVMRELGRGGMATVYLAEDLKHGRRVAIKVLSADVAAALGTARFLREIEVAASLVHPNILPLHDSGEANGLLYYVMPFVEGETLRERLTREKQLRVEDAIRLAREIADALGYAHDAGVMHRDIKPENILLAGDRPLVSDFGIATAIDAAGSERLTQTGIAIGTPSYMSPEQASGSRSIDQRSDVYSLACVVYEMLGGEPPFTGPSPQALIARHIVDPVPNVRTLRPTVSEGVRRALEKALAKVPADRFTTATQFAEALAKGLTVPDVVPARGAATVRRRAVIGTVFALVLAGGGWLAAKTLTTADPARLSSLAVLPFDDPAADAEQEYLVAGMHDALIAELAQISALRVTSRTSVLRYRDSQKSIPEIARELNVDGVVEASVSRAGDSVRLRLRLIQAAPEERHLIVRSYGNDLRHVLALYNEVARDIANEINVTLTPQETSLLTSHRPVNRETYEAYLRGKAALSQFTPEGFAAGLAYLHRAIQSDSTDPLAYAGLALGYSLVASHSPAPPPDAIPRAKVAALRAVQLDGTLAEAHSALAQVRLYHDWDWTGAEQSFRRALDLNPSLAEAHAHYAWYHILFGREADAIAEMKRAQEVDPLEPLWTTWLGDLHMAVGKWDAAINDLKNALRVFPEFRWAHHVLGLVYAERGLHNEAAAAHEKAVAANPAWRWGLGHAYALAGRQEEARRIAAELENVAAPDAWGLALVYTALGETDDAFRWVERAYRTRHPFTPWFNSALFASLRDDPRFHDLLRRLKLPA